MYVDQTSVSQMFFDRKMRNHCLCVVWIINFNFGTGMVFQPAVIKLFKSVIYNFTQKEGACVIVTHFCPSLTFVSKSKYLHLSKIRPCYEILDWGKSVCYLFINNIWKFYIERSLSLSHNHLKHLIIIRKRFICYTASCYTQTHYAKCCYAECRGAPYRGLDFNCRLLAYQANLRLGWM
jgi:hypothetical protein